MLTVLLTGIILVPFSTFMKRYDIFNKLFHTKHGKAKWLRYTLGIIIILLFVFISSIIATSVAPYVNDFLDNVRESMIKSTI